ncbi:MAG: AFG1/ZapE family ATPase, partial [Alphaproteobacteria bacterium]
MRFPFLSCAMPENLEGIYKARIAKAGLTQDPAQVATLRSLQRLYDEVARPVRANKKILKKILSSFSPRGEGIRGIYIYGGVGRGKSMLMDLFYAALPEGILKRRVHFHQFMIEVHEYIHSRREDDDFDDGIDGVLPALASRIAERSRVLCFDEFHITDV